MPNFSGIWSASQQFQARGQNIWPRTPGAPTIGTATAGTSNCASVTFSAPGCTGYPASISSYTATSTPGGFTVSGASSPLTVTGLTNATSYTFKVKATNAGGLTGDCSAASNSITAVVTSCVTYTSAGTYTFIAPSSSITVLAIGAGAQGVKGGGGGGGLGYLNNYSVTIGNSYTVRVGATGNSGGDSYFISTCVVKGGGGMYGFTCCRLGGTYTGTGGGNGGAGGPGTSSCGGGGGGGAGGYSGSGGLGGTGVNFPGNGTNGSSGSGGGGGGGGGAGSYPPSCRAYGGAGGGVGLYGIGSSGSGGHKGSTACGSAVRGGNGSGGTNDSTQRNGGLYGGGGGARGGGNNCTACGTGIGGGGAVRILWNAAGRGVPSFPSTNVGP